MRKYYIKNDDIDEYKKIINNINNNINIKDKLFHDSLKDDLLEWANTPTVCMSSFSMNPENYQPSGYINYTMSYFPNYEPSGFANMSRISMYQPSLLRVTLPSID